MRVKSLVAAVGVAVVTTLIVVPGVSNASRGTGTTDPLVQPSAEVAVDEETPAVPPADEAPAEPAVEESPTAPAAEEPPTAPVAEEPPAEPVTEKPDAPVVDVPPAAEKPPVAEEPPAEPVTETPPVVEEPVVVTMQPEEAPAPAAKPGKGHAKKDRGQEAGPCHMDSYEARPVSGFAPGSGEAARADKVDRNDNGTVCRKDIPGRGRGNTGEGSNIKDDQAR